MSQCKYVAWFTIPQLLNDLPVLESFIRCYQSIFFESGKHYSSGDVLDHLERNAGQEHALALILDIDRNVHGFCLALKNNPLQIKRNLRQTTHWRRSEVSQIGAQIEARFDSNSVIYLDSLGVAKATRGSILSQRMFMRVVNRMQNMMATRDIVCRPTKNKMLLAMAKKIGFWVTDVTPQGYLFGRNDLNKLVAHSNSHAVGS